MANNRLTATRINKIRYSPDKKGKQIAYDGQLPGFGVRVYATGRKSYVLRYGPRQKQRLITLGPATTGDDVEEMREYAQSLLRKYRTDGADPLANRQHGTVAAVVGAYIKARKAQWSDGEIKNAEGRLRRHMAGIANTSLDKLTRREVREMHLHVSTKAGAKKSGSPVEANRTLALLRAAINWALAEGGWRAGELREGENPAARVKANPERHRREWIQLDELPSLLGAIDQEENPWLRAFFRMLLFTGARKSELLNLQWSDVDLKAKTITFRDTKNREDHQLPLAKEAVKLLTLTPRTLGNPYVFCGHNKGRPLHNPYKPWKRILKRAGIERSIRIHDIRRTVGSLLASQGYSTQQIGKLLNHKSEITAKVYAEIADQAKQEMTGAMAKMLK